MAEDGGQQPVVKDVLPTNSRWHPKEDQALLDCRSQNDSTKWKEIPKILSQEYDVHGKSEIQCIQRWQYFVNPSIDKSPITDPESETIFEAYQKLGNRWSEIK